LLAACAYKAFQDDPHQPVPEGMRKVAVAVECFHKASLIHDDIEDDDTERYGEQTVHAQYGVPVALNVGDLLVGEGYRLLAESEAPPQVIAQMMRITSAGHRSLCLGQGAELCWSRERTALSVQEVLGIFRLKTAPAFEVALRLGAAYAQADDDVQKTLTRYSEALGIAYQIRDDLDDLSVATNESRPSLPVGRDRARQLLESYKEAAVRSLTELDNPSLKGLLRRVIAKIFRVEIQGWCSEFEARNAASSAVVTEAAR
jgi:geranylgeranyl pyrophosphate synthase